MYNEWLDLFGLESIWNDPDWPCLADYLPPEDMEEKQEVDNVGYYLFNKLRGK